jgi:hypothetical protein
MADVMDTAAAVAWMRAREADLPAGDRLFDDPFARLFARGPAECDATALMLQAPFMRESIRIRTRYIDDALRAGLRAGVRQVLILGYPNDCLGLAPRTQGTVCPDRSWHAPAEARAQRTQIVGQKVFP